MKSSPYIHIIVIHGHSSRERQDNHVSQVEARKILPIKVKWRSTKDSTSLIVIDSNSWKNLIKVQTTDSTKSYIIPPQNINGTTGEEIIFYIEPTIIFFY